MTYRFHFPVLAIALLAGCQDQRVVVMDASQSGAAGMAVPRPAPVPPRRVVNLSPCRSPAGTGPFEHLTQPIAWHPAPPTRAVTERVSGCAGIRFRLGPDGVPRDVTLMAEYPVGYGFGQSGLAAVRDARWAPTDDLAWRYLIVNLNLTARG